MPVDKFGRHLHQHHHHHAGVEESKLYLVKDGTNILSEVHTTVSDLESAINKELDTLKSSLKYQTMFYIIGLSTDSKGRVNIINSDDYEYSYKLPPGAIIDVRYTPPSYKLVVNNVQWDASAITGLVLKTGDKISVKGPRNSKIIFACEFVLALPVFHSV